MLTPADGVEVYYSAASNPDDPILSGVNSAGSGPVYSSLLPDGSVFKTNFWDAVEDGAYDPLYPPPLTPLEALVEEDGSHGVHNAKFAAGLLVASIEALGGTSVESTVKMSESNLARVHLIIRTDPADSPRIQVRGLERRLEEAVRTWKDRLRSELGVTIITATSTLATRFATVRDEIRIRAAEWDISKTVTPAGPVQKGDMDT